MEIQQKVANKKVFQGIKLGGGVWGGQGWGQYGGDMEKPH